MKILLVVSVAFASIFTLSAQDKNAIKGEWFNEEKEGRIEISEENGKFYGKLIWLKEPKEDGKPKTDKNNPDKSKRDRPLKGLRILEGFEYKNGSWENGEIYDPKSGKTYSCIMKLKNRDTLEVRGYVGISLIGRTTTWTRAD
ncbi:DUF2147 domain-containing protein [Pleomorphovibrio marinus]|uniref:DUF2147 domain-containing protein n=1 Tax=Pleomorphovibrio marinus TaxID=2164132 RepID=UPI000E0B8758|nr:DUF2147 domain-containing protein [Pleomorphovibrio marinus]